MASKQPQVRDALRKVLDAQLQFSAKNTPAMQERHAELAAACEGVRRLIAGRPWAKGLEVGSSDGIGNRSIVPQVRVYVPARSPSPTEGIYVVFLFRGDGAGVYLSVNQGTHQTGDGNLAQRASDVLQQRATEARALEAGSATVAERPGCD